MLFKVQGIVLKAINFNDWDKILTIYTKQHGKIQAIAKGVRRPKSKNISSTQVFSLSEFILYKGKKLYNLNQSETIKSYYPLRDNLEKLSYASYILELTNAGLIEEETNTKIFELLLKTLDIIVEEEKYDQITRAFELKFISYLGYRPHLINCVNCHKDLDNNIRFSVINSGALCNECKSTDRYSKKLDIQTLNIMKFLLFTSYEEILNIDIDKNTLKNIGEIMLLFISKNLDKTNFKSLNFINSLNI
ncbi:DNA repair protein RecO [Senegalia massiliensis]|uniref:DNA repair protein RecO n=1 Tax=Senegalia massiliensis TaxID=1720316 RepID=UPI0010321684|nr:DNA repair protein RecO [Senegalia massiliensis]